MARVPESVLIWGAGGHGRVVAEISRAAGYNVIGFVDAMARRGAVVDAAGAQVVMLEAELVACLHGAQPLPLGARFVIPAVGDNRNRFEQMNALGALLAPAMIHPSAVVSPSAAVGAGTVVGPLAVINTGARVGRGVIINTGAVAGHDSVVEDGAHVGARAVLNGGARVGARTFLAAGAILLPCVHVGADVTIGAGAVVLKNLADGVTAVGVPARLVESKRNGSGEQNLSISASSVGA